MYPFLKSQKYQIGEFFQLINFCLISFFLQFINFFRISKLFKNIILSQVQVFYFKFMNFFNFMCFFSKSWTRVWNTWIFSNWRTVFKYRNFQNLRTFFKFIKNQFHDFCLNPRTFFSILSISFFRNLGSFWKSTVDQLTFDWASKVEWVTTKRECTLATSRWWRDIYRQAHQRRFAPRHVKRWLGALASYTLLVVRTSMNWTEQVVLVH